MTGRYGHYIEDPYVERGAARSRSPTRSPSRSSAAGSPASSPPRGWCRRASPTCASSRRAATSAAPGTGTATRARSATWSRTSTCRCSRRPATSRRRSTRTRPEIQEHCRRLGEHFGLYDNACLSTEVTGLEWDDAASRWIIRTNRGDAMRAQYVVDRRRAAAPAEAPGHPRHRGLRGPQLPHQPLGLRLHRR